jgi:hypothetical protein
MFARLIGVVLAGLFAVAFLQIGFQGMQDSISRLAFLERSQSFLPITAKVAQKELRRPDPDSERLELLLTLRYSFRGSSFQPYVPVKDLTAGRVAEIETVLASAEGTGAEIDVWVDPAQPWQLVLEQPMPKAPAWAQLLFAVPFLLCGAAAAVFATRAIIVTETDRAKALSRQFELDPQQWWRTNPDWQRGKIPAAHPSHWAWIFGAAFWNAICVGMLISNTTAPQLIGWQRSLLWILSAVGVSLIYQSWCASLAARRFARPLLCMAQTPFRLGQQAAFAIEFTTRFAAGRTFEIVLECQLQDTSGSSTTKSVRYASDTVKVRANPTADGAILRHYFAIPANQAASTPVLRALDNHEPTSQTARRLVGKSAPSHEVHRNVWLIKLVCKQYGFVTEFEVPVLAAPVLAA